MNYKFNWAGETMESRKGKSENCFILFFKFVFFNFCAFMV